MRKTVLLFAVLLAAGSCQAKSSLLVLLDPYSRALWEARGLGPEALRRGLSVRFHAQIHVVDPLSSPLQEVERLLAGRRAGWVYVSPLLPLDAHALASRFPALRIVQEGAGPGPEPNLIRLEYEWEQAFRRAGRSAARLLQLEAFKSILAPARAGAPYLKAALVSAQPSLNARRRLEAFRAGFDEAADPALLLEQDLGTLSDTARARRVLEVLREQDAVIYLLQTYGLTGFCLEHLRLQGGLAVLEDSVGGAGYEEQVVLSLQEDLPAALSLLGGPAEQTVLRAPVRLVWGKPASALKPEIRAQLDE